MSRVTWLFTLGVLLVGCVKDPVEERKPGNAYCQKQVVQNQFLAVYQDGRYKVLNKKALTTALRSSPEKLRWYEPSYRLNLNSSDSELVLNSFAQEKRNNDVLWNQSGFFSFYNQGYYGQNITVAVIDSGVDTQSPYLAGRWLFNQNEIPNNQVDDDQNGFTDDFLGWNFKNKNSTQIDEPQHGTRIAHIIAGSINSPSGQGVAPRAFILPLDFIDESGGSEAAAIEAIDYALSRKAKIINNSWVLVCSSLLQEKYQQWSTQNVLFIHAAGNSQTQLSGDSPSSSNFYGSNYLSVGALDFDDTRAVFSNYGPNILIYAYGIDLSTTGPRTPISFFPAALKSGTSYAAAVVAGAAALIWSQHPNWSAQQVRQAILRSSIQENGMAILRIRSQ